MEKKFAPLILGDLYTSGGGATQYIKNVELGDQGIGIHIWNTEKQIEKGKAYAEHIVNAVNSHYDLVEALKNSLDELECIKNTSTGILTTKAIIKAALEKATQQ